jgi:uncharacterized membrane protein (DUF106 family)
MKIGNKLILVTVIAICTLAVFVSAASAQLSTYSISITNTNNGVNEVSSYTLTVTDISAPNLGAVNVTIPNGYNNIENLALTQQPASQVWNITYIPPVINSGQVTALGVIKFVNTTGQGLTTGQSLTATFEAKNPITAATYMWTSEAVGSIAPATVNSVIAISTIVPALEILFIAAGIAFLNTGINRVLVGYFIGWEQYRVMQKEMAEYRSETMAAARANDQKRMEKLKKKQSQINHMQSKMMKPQMIQIAISFLYIIVWFLVLIPVFGTTSMAYLPGFGPLPVVWLYPIFSLFLGLLSQRLLGVNPIEM